MARIPSPAGGAEIEITLRRSARARRISLRVSSLDGQVSLTLPPRVPAAEGLRFAKDRAEWIVQALARVPQGASVAIGASLLVEGRALVLTQGPQRGSVTLSGDEIVVPGPPERAALRVATFLKALARDRLSQASDRYAAQIGRKYKSLTLRDTRSRWGSCTADGSLMYSWRLIMAPPAVLDYVAAHEVAHLAEMNHSDRFWAVVEGLMPDYAPRRKWLKEHGGRLHAYRFED